MFRMMETIMNLLDLCKSFAEKIHDEETRCRLMKWRIIF